MSERDRLNSDADYLELYAFLEREEEANKEKVESKEIRNFTILMCVLCLVIAVLEFFTRAPLENMGNIIISGLPKSDASCSWLNTLSITSHFTAFMFLFIVIYNIFDMYSTFVFLGLFVTGKIINGILILIYQSPRPFWVLDSFIPCICKVSYGNPSDSAVSSFLIIMGLFRIVTYRTTNTLLRYSFLLFCLGIVTVTNIFDLLKKTESLSQIIFGLLVASVIYQSYFKILNIDFDSPEKFQIVVERNYGIKLSLLITGIAILLNIGHYFLRNFIRFTEDDWFTRLETSCSDQKAKFLDKESYFMLNYVFLLLGSVFSIYIEYRSVFLCNTEQFSEYNLGSFNRWNQTSISFQMLRIFFTFALFRLFNGIIERNFKNESTSLYLIIFSSTLFFWGFFIFFISKFCFRLCCWTNEAVVTDYISIEVSKTSKSKKKKKTELLNPEHYKTHFITGDGLLKTTSGNESKKNKNDIDYFNLERDNLIELKNASKDFNTPIPSN